MVEVRQMSHVPWGTEHGFVTRDQKGLGSLCWGVTAGMLPLSIINQHLEKIPYTMPSGNI